VRAGAVDDVTFAGADEPPVVVLDPVAPRVDSPSLTLTGHVDEDVELASLTISVGGAPPTPVEVGGSPSDPSRPFTTSLELTKGANAIELVATDSLGQTGTASTQVELVPPVPPTTATSTPSTTTSTATTTTTEPTTTARPTTTTGRTTTSRATSAVAGGGGGFSWPPLAGAAGGALALAGAALAAWRARRLRWERAAGEAEPTGPCGGGWACRRGAPSPKPALRRVERVVLASPGLDDLELEGELPKALRRRRLRRDDLRLRLIGPAAALLGELERWAGAGGRHVSVTAHVEGSKVEVPFELYRCHGGRWRKVREWSSELEQSEDYLVTTVLHPGADPVALAAELARFVEELREVGLPRGARAGLTL